MQRGLWALMLLASSWAAGQTCTTYVMVDPFDDKTKKGIDGLKADDFEAKLGDVSLPIVSSSQSFSNRILVLVEADNSGGNAAVAGLVGTVADITRKAPQGRPVAFGVFGERVLFTEGFADNLLKDRNAGVDEVMARAQSLGDRPALFDALHDALAFFGQHQPGDTIVLVSDGHDAKSRRNGRDLEREFSERGTRLLVMIRPDNRLVGQDWKLRKREENFTLRELCSRTGGAYNRTLAPQFFEFAWVGYLLGIKVPTALDKPKSWKLQLRGAADKAHKDALIFYPWELTPCGQASSAP